METTPQALQEMLAPIRLTVDRCTQQRQVPVKCAPELRCASNCSATHPWSRLAYPGFGERALKRAITMVRVVVEEAEPPASSPPLRSKAPRNKIQRAFEKEAEAEAEGSEQPEPDPQLETTAGTYAPPPPHASSGCSLLVPPLPQPHSSPPTHRRRLCRPGQGREGGRGGRAGPVEAGHSG